jgi:hypothetical protein
MRMCFRLFFFYPTRNHSVRCEFPWTPGTVLFEYRPYFASSYLHSKQASMMSECEVSTWGMKLR